MLCHEEKVPNQLWDRSVKHAHFSSLGNMNLDILDFPGIFSMLIFLTADVKTDRYAIMLFIT